MSTKEEHRWVGAGTSIFSGHTWTAGPGGCSFYLKHTHSPLDRRRDACPLGSHIKHHSAHGSFRDVHPQKKVWPLSGKGQ